MRYQIRVQGHLDGDWSAWFDGLAISNLANGEMVLAGDLADQAALHGVLARVRDLGLPLLAVPPAAEPDLRPWGGRAIRRRSGRDVPTWGRRGGPNG